LIFGTQSLHLKNSLSAEEISRIVGAQLQEDVGLPPRTGFPHVWLYRIDKPVNDIYSMVDSLFKYDNDVDFDSNMNSYTGKVICY